MHKHTELEKEKRDRKHTVAYLFVLGERDRQTDKNRDKEPSLGQK